MRDEIISFLKRVGGKETEIDLCDASVDKAIVRSFGPGELGAEDAAADLILDQCKLDASGRSGRVRFELIATREGKRVGRHAIVIDAGRGEFGEDDATVRGLVIECMRDRRDAWRISNGAMEEIFRRQNELLQSFQSSALEVEKNKLEMFRLIESLVSQKHERDLEVRKSEREDRTTARMTETFVPLLQQATNRLIARAAGGGKSTAIATKSQVADFFNSFDKEQLAAIFPILTGQQQAALGMIIDAAEAEQEAEEKKINHGVNGTGGVG